MDIKTKILALKKEKNAIILVHNYQIPEVQDVADAVGDSLGLSIQAAKTDADVIVFCGVHFMAETAKILSPAKTVLIPDKNAGCPMADMINADQLRALKKAHPGARAMCYVNTTAEVKAECDLCCTSANAMKIVNAVFKPEEEVIFVPDKYLAHYIATKTGRNFIYWRGFCPTHARILPEDIDRQRRLHPQAEVLAHPECTPGVLEKADMVLSTEGICRRANEGSAREYIIATETGMLYRLGKENPDKIFYAASERAVCPNMKLTTLEKVLWSLQEMTHEVTVPEDVMDRARVSIRRMLEYV
ncbi:MAG: quinolinate synthase NadA [Smithellaceae bacterium]|nr:quinolinate synthase NadA [Smithellaceae bacterium]